MIRRARSCESGHLHQHITNVGACTSTSYLRTCFGECLYLEPYLRTVGISHRFVLLGFIIRRVSPFCTTTQL